MGHTLDLMSGLNPKLLFLTIYLEFLFRRGRLSVKIVIFQQVTIGSNTLPDSQRPGAPVIGDNVYIGAGVKIIGGVKVGNNVRIGANAVIFTDVPDNCVAVVNGVRTIHKSEPLDNRFMPISKLKESE